MGINMTSHEAIEGQIKALRDVPKKWNIPSTFRLDLILIYFLLSYYKYFYFIIFSLEFVSYFFERNLRLTDLKNQLQNFTDRNKKLHEKQTIVQEKYNQVKQLFYNLPTVHQVI